MTRLRVVPPAPVPEAERVRQRIKRMPRPATMLECRCGCRELIEARTGVLFNGRPKGGTRQLLCLACLQRGERVVVA